MAHTTFEQLWLRIGAAAGYVYCHQVVSMAYFKTCGTQGRFLPCMLVVPSACNDPVLVSACGAGSPICKNNNTC